MGSQDTLEEKTVTVCYGSDFVNVNFVNFSCTKKEIAQVSIVNPPLFLIINILLSKTKLACILEQHNRWDLTFLWKNIYTKHVLWDSYISILSVCVFCVRVKWNLIIFLFFFALLDNTNKIPKRVNVSKQLFSTSMH